MKFNDVEKKLITELVKFDFSSTATGVSFLNKYFCDEDDRVYLVTSNRINHTNGKYYICFKKGDQSQIKKKREVFYKYINLIQLIRTLQNEGLIIVVKDDPLKHKSQNPQPKTTIVGLDKYIFQVDTNNAICQFTTKEDMSNEFDLDNGTWTIQSNTNDDTVVCYEFTDNTLPIRDFLFGMIYVSTDLRNLVDNKFQTAEDQELKIAKRGICISRVGIIVSFFVAIFSSIASVYFSLYTDKTPDDVKVCSDDSLILGIKSDIYNIKQNVDDIKQNIDSINLKKLDGTYSIKIKNLNKRSNTKVDFSINKQ